MPTHKYNNAGVYDVLLIVTDNNLCVDSVWKKNHVVILGPKGSVSITEDTSNCRPLQVTFYPSVEQELTYNPDSITIYPGTGEMFTSDVFKSVMPIVEVKIA